MFLFFHRKSTRVLTQRWEIKWSEYTRDFLSRKASGESLRWGVEEKKKWAMTERGNSLAEFDQLPVGNSGWMWTDGVWLRMLYVYTLSQKF